MDSLKGLHEEAEIQCKVMGQGKNLAFGKDTYLEKKKKRSKVTSREVGQVEAVRRVKNGEAEKRLTCRFVEKEKASHFA